MATSSTWVVCLNLRGGRVFTFSPDDGIKFFREFRRPTIMTKRADLLEPSELSEIPKPIESPQKEWQVANSFSKYVAGEMEKGCRNGSFDSVIFCAEPVLLDILFRSIGICTNSAIIGKVPLDLYEVNESDLVNYIKDIIGQAGTSEAA